MSILELHLFAVAFWFGLLAMETVMELYIRKPERSEARKAVAKIHALSDQLFELPAITVTLVTGVMLLAQSWPPTPLLLLKVLLGGSAILVNYWCYSFVRQRARDTASDAQRIHWTRCIAWTGWAMIPGMLAFVIGLFYLH